MTTPSGDAALQDVQRLIDALEIESDRGPCAARGRTEQHSLPRCAGPGQSHARSNYESPGTSESLLVSRRPIA